MGSGGFFNYEKAGPGVKKDAPQKKGFFTFFEIWLRNFWKLIPVSAVWVLSQLLIVTCGLGEAGMANVCRNLARDKHSFGISDFFSTIKKNWKQALPAGIINLAATVLLLLAGRFYFKGEGLINILAFGFTAAIFIIFTFIKYHIWLLIITFKLPLKKMYKNCFLFTFINIKSNLIIGLCSILVTGGVCALFLIPNSIAYTIAAFLLICVVPGFVGLMIQMLIFPKVKKLMIDPYYAEHPDEDKEVRRNLGLEVEEDEENLFDDTHPQTEE